MGFAFSSSHVRVAPGQWDWLAHAIKSEFKKALFKQRTIRIDWPFPGTNSSSLEIRNNVGHARRQSSIRRYVLLSLGGSLRATVFAQRFSLSRAIVFDIRLNDTKTRRRSRQRCPRTRRDSPACGANSARHYSSLEKQIEQSWVGARTTSHPRADCCVAVALAA